MTDSKLDQIDLSIRHNIEGTPERKYKLELLKYFYENQYDEERFPHFRMCDRHIEYDDDGNRYPTYSFYG
tara:strand:+ start:87 stop:296 length:210 start_codon:yes stop_codon:yes gene_type:complete